VTDVILSLFFCVLLGAFSYIVRLRTGSWAAPGAIFALAWTALAGVPLLVLWNGPINALAVGYIALCCMMFGASVFLFDWGLANQSNEMKATSRQLLLSNGRLRKSLYMFSVLSVIFIAIDLYVQGISLAFFAEDFFAASNQYLLMRYDGDLVQNPFAQWGLAFAYMANIVGGLLHEDTKTRSGVLLIILLAFVPAILILLFQAAKGLFVACLAIYWGGIVLRRVLLNIRPHVDFKGLFWSMRYGLLILPLLVISFLSRGLYKSEDSGQVLGILLDYFASYALMHIYAFSDWFTFATGGTALGNYVNEATTYGIYTFSSLMRLAGFDFSLPPGTYAEYFSFGEFRPGNIYSMFRGTIQDFGMLGGLAFFSVVGLLFNSAYYWMLRSRYPVMSLALMIMFVQFTYSSYLISWFMSNIAYVVFVLCIGLVILPRLVGKSSRSVKSSARTASSGSLI